MNRAPGSFWLGALVLALAALGASLASVAQDRVLEGGDVAAAWGGGELGVRLTRLEQALPAIEAHGWRRVAIVRSAGSNPMIGLLQQRLYPAVVVPIWQGQSDLERGFTAARKVGAEGLVRMSKAGQVELFAVPAPGVQR